MSKDEPNNGNPESIYRDAVWLDEVKIGFDIVPRDSASLGGATLAWANDERTDVVVAQGIPVNSAPDENRPTAYDYVTAFAGGQIGGTDRLDLPLY